MVDKSFVRLFVRTIFFTAALFLAACSVVTGWRAARYYQSGLELETKGLASQAIQAYAKAAEFDPQNAAAFLRMGRLYYDGKDFEHARTALEKAAVLDAHSAEAFYLLARIHLQNHDTASALQDLDQDLALDKKNADAFYQRGVIRVGKRELAPAAADFDQAIALDANSSPPYYQRALVSVKLGDLDRAAADFGRVIDLDSKNADAFFQRGLVFAAKPARANAIQDFSQAIQLKPDWEEAYWQRAITYEQSGKADEAIADYQKVGQLNPANASTFYHAGLLLAHSKRAAESAAAFDQAVAQDAYQKDAWYQRGLAYVQTGDLAKAIESFNQVVALDPAYPQIYATRAAALIDQGSYGPGSADLDKALQAEPHSSRLLLLRGYALYRNKGFREALADFQAVVDQDSQAAAALYDLGVAHARLDEWDQADTYLTKAVQLKPTANAYHARAEARFELRSYQGAVEDFRTALKLDPSLKSVQMEMALAYLLQGDLKGAAQAGRDYLVLAPEAKDAVKVKLWADSLDAELDGNTGINLTRFRSTMNDQPGLFPGPAEVIEEAGNSFTKSLKSDEPKLDLTMVLRDIDHDANIYIFLTRAPTLKLQQLVDSAIYAYNRGGGLDNGQHVMSGLDGIGDTRYGRDGLYISDGRKEMETFVLFRRGMLAVFYGGYYPSDGYSPANVIEMGKLLDKIVISTLATSVPQPVGSQALWEILPEKE